MSQLFTPKFRIDECLEEIKECLEMGWTGLGFKTIQIEEAWKKFTGLPNAHFLASNTVGLHLALEILKREYEWDDGSEVITTPLTFVSTNHSILYAGLKPVFADIDDSLCLDPEKVAASITPRTKAIMFVGIGGNTGKLHEIEAIAREHGLKLILDAAHMAGSRVDGIHVGHTADVSIFSFQAVKNLPTADSGMICFSDARLDSRARKLSWLGIDKDTYARTTNEGAYKWRYEVDELGYKYHGNSIMASLALVGLRYLDVDNSYRRQIAVWYKSLLINNPKVKFVEITGNCESSTHLFQIIVDKREEIMLALNREGIFPGVHYRDNLDYELYAQYSGTCPKASDLSSKIISLPIHMSLTYEEVRHIAEVVNQVTS